MAPNVALVYGSFAMGDCERDIKMIQKAFPKISGLEVAAKPVEGNKFDFDSLKDAKFLVVCTSSQLGMPPDNFMEFAHQLLRASQNPEKPLKHLQHCVFGNGDETYYKTYMNMPRYMDLLLEKAGSRRFFARGEKGEPHAPTKTKKCQLNKWTEAMWKAMEAASKAELEPVKWDALWEKDASEAHHKVTEWNLETLNKLGEMTQKPSVFAKL